MSKMNPKGYWLKEGEQTRITLKVKKYANEVVELTGLTPDINSDSYITRLIETTCKYIKHLPKMIDYISNAETNAEKIHNNSLKEKIFRKRTIDQILDEGIYPTCSDIGVVFRGFMIANNIPTLYVETFHQEYIQNENNFHTHSFAKVKLSKMTIYVDPTKGEIMGTSEQGLFPYIALYEGKDSWDVGIKSEKDIHDARKENLEYLKQKYEKLKV